MKDRVRRGFPEPNQETLDAIFECVYHPFEPVEEELPNDPKLRDFGLLAVAYSSYVHKYCDYEPEKTFPLAESAVGEFEMNSEGYTFWLSMVVAVKELYCLSYEELPDVLNQVTVRK